MLSVQSGCWRQSRPSEGKRRATASSQNVMYLRPPKALQIWHEFRNGTFLTRRKGLATLLIGRSCASLRGFSRTVRELLPPERREPLWILSSARQHAEFEHASKVWICSRTISPMHRRRVSRRIGNTSGSISQRKRSEERRVGKE